MVGVYRDAAVDLAAMPVIAGEELTGTSISARHTLLVLLWFRRLLHVMSRRMDSPKCRQLAAAP